MLERIEQIRTKKSQVQAQLDSLKAEISKLGNLAKAHKMPVIITFDGWSAAGKGSQISKLIKNLDPRFYNVVSFRTPNMQEKRRPWLYRYWQVIPKSGEFLILDRSWYRDTVNAYMFGEISKSEYKKRLNDINVMERQLADDGYLIIKFFMHISSNEQRQRLKKLADSQITKWRVDEQDIVNMENYDKFLRLYDKMICCTNTSSAVWHIVPADDKTTAEFSIMTTVANVVKQAAEAVQNGCEYKQQPEFPIAEAAKEQFKTLKHQKLSEIDMSKSLSDEEYEKKLKKYQSKLFELQNICYEKKIPVVIAYEGWDAAGKGGNIKRVAAALDPRGYDVKPIAAPEPSELARHYLWRFWTRLEKDGHFTIFDRTWYGRVMVEAIEKITPTRRTEMAYREINEFERQLADWGAVIIKFWVNVDKQEQYRRFKERENTPEKRWKITDEDWRNREKWDEYEKAVNKMLKLTSTDFAPWSVLEGNDKKYARVKALKIICKRLEEEIEK